MERLNYAEICINNTNELETMLVKAQEVGIDVLVISNPEEFNYNDVLNSKMSYDSTKKVLETFKGKILGMVKVPVSYKGRIVQVKFFTNNITRTRAILEKNCFPKNIINLREYDAINSRFAALGIKFVLENVKLVLSKESSLKSWFNEISNYEENRRFLLFPNSFDDFKLFSRDESYNPESRLFIDRSFFYPSLEGLLEVFNNERVYTVLTTVDKIEITGDNILGFVDDIMYNFDIDGIEFRSLRYSEALMKILENYCLENNKLICKKNALNLKKINGRLNLSNNVVDLDKKVINY